MASRMMMIRRQGKGNGRLSEIFPHSLYETRMGGMERSPRPDG